MARYKSAVCYAGGYRYIFGISPRPASPKEFNLFFLSFAQPSAVYNRVCKSSHGGRVKQSYRNRCLLSRSADFLYSIDGNPLGEAPTLTPNQQRVVERSSNRSDTGGYKTLQLESSVLFETVFHPSIVHSRDIIIANQFHGSSEKRQFFAQGTDIKGIMTGYRLRYRTAGSVVSRLSRVLFPLSTSKRVSKK